MKKDSTKKEIKKKVTIEDIEKQLSSKSEEEKVTLFGLAKMSREVSESIVAVEDNELRFLIDNYYQTQTYRISIANQIRSIIQGVDGDGGPVPISLQWLLNNVTTQELELKKLFEIYSDNNPVCRWAKSIIGIGPVFSVVLYSYFDITKTGHYNTFWSYAGLNDNNNPWLGTEKAKELVDEIYYQRDERVKEIDKLCKDALTKTKYNNIEKIYKSFECNDELLIRSLKDSEKTKELYNLIHSYDYSDIDIVEYLAHRYDKYWVTDNMLMKVYTKMQGKRKLETLRKECIDTKNKSKTFGHRNRNSLKAYLAKPPYNTELKKFMYLIGESFAKVSNKEGSLYGRLYKERKAWEISKNESGQYREQAAKYLTQKKYDKNTETYKAYIQGKLPDTQITRRAERYATKLFISHLFECMHLWYYGEPAPLPYPISHMGHVDYIGPEVPYEKFIKVKK